MAAATEQNKAKQTNTENRYYTAPKKTPVQSSKDSTQAPVVFSDWASI